MIGEGQFQTQIATCESLLKDLGLLEERIYAPNKALGAAHFKRMTYRQLYTESIKQYAYDLRLTDQSLMLFIKGGSDEHNGSLGFSYYDCPVEIGSYEDFVGQQF